MTRIERFEELVAWQQARELTRQVYSITRSGPFSKDFGLSGKIQRSATSVVANIAEGFDRGGRAEFHQFLSVAKGSCAEVRSHLYVAFDAGYISQSGFDALLGLAEEVTRIVAGLRSAVGRQRDEQRNKPHD